MKVESPEKHLAGFIARYSPEIAALAEAVLVKMRERLPGAVELVYDNYNALAIGFGPGEKTSDAIFSIALYPRWVSLFFLQNATLLRDPEKLLKGSGKVVRHIALKDASDLDKPAIQKLMAHSLKLASEPIDPANQNRIIIKSVSNKQRPRRPS